MPNEERLPLSNRPETSPANNASAAIRNELRVGTRISTVNNAANAAIRKRMRSRDLVIGNRSGSSRLRSMTDKAITHAHDSLDAIATVFKLLTQASNVHIKGPGVAIVTVAPDLIEKLLASNHAARARQHRQQSK